MLSSSSSKVVVSSNSEALEKEIKQHKDNNLALSREIDNLRSKLSQSINDLKNKDAEIARFHSEKQTYLSEIAALKDAQTATSASRSQLVILESEVASYKIKVSQMASLEQNQRNSLTKISELEMTIRKWENDFKRMEGDYKKLEADFKKIEI